MAEVPYYLKKTDGAYLLLTTGARIILDYTSIGDECLTHILELDTTTDVLEMEATNLAELDVTADVLELEAVDVQELDTTVNIICE